LQDNLQKNIRIGIIGAENSHTIGFGNLFNTEKKFPGMEVKYVWGETDEFAKNAMQRGNIPQQVKDPNEMLGKIDALIVDHRHAKYHLEPAVPFIKEKIPTFIDKPFCYRAAEGQEFLQLAKKMGTPVTSYSSIAQSDATFRFKRAGKGNERHQPDDLHRPGRS
jgi:predicted dehydrogenase